MAGIHVSHAPAVQIQNAIEERYEEHLLVFHGQEIIEPPDAARRRALEQRGRTQQGARYGHEERGGHALAGHVRHHEAEGGIVDEEIIVEVAAHLARRRHMGIEFNA